MENEPEVNELLDKVVDYAEDWDELLEMLAIAKGPLLKSYLEKLIPRLGKLNRKFNRVEKVLFKEGNYWSIQNYSYEVYKYFMTKYPDAVVCTPMCLYLIEDRLTQKDNDFLRSKMPHD